ncbi:MAG TPA: zf-TFIIB domain-containing protein [Polyangiaceae bacterium]
MANETMRCPRCQGAELEERERDGVVVDVCRSCRGLWLDRGELEKLIARATRELDEYGPRRDDDTPPRGVRYRDDDEHHRQHDYRRDPRRKKSFFESLGDIFD